MPRKPFLPRSETARQQWLNQFVNALQDSAKGYAAKYNIPAATLAALDQGRQWVNWVMDNLSNPRETAQTLTAFKNLLFTGAGTLTIPTQTLFTAVPSTGAPPAPIPPEGGVFTLASSVGGQIKRAVNYDLADGEDMGLEGAEILPPDPATVQPDLAATRIASGGFVEIVWKKGPFDALKIEVDRGTGFTFLAIDTEPDYLDTIKPAPGATALYTYRAIYLLGDAEYGQWSQPVEITVRG